MHVRVIRSNDKYKLIEPLNTLSDSFGYLMVVNRKGEVVKFFQADLNTRNKAIKYVDYLGLSRWEKIKYWLNYKRGD